MEAPKAAADGTNIKKEQVAPNKKAGNKPFAPRVPKFEGETPELKGYIYDCSDNKQSDQSMKTTKEVAGFVGKTYRYGGDIRILVETLIMPTFRIPDDPRADAIQGERRIWEKTLDESVKRASFLQTNIQTLYSLVWGQCTEFMRQTLEAFPTFATIKGENDGLALLILIKNMAYQFQNQKYLPHSLHEALKRYYSCYQGKFTTTQAYMETFQNLIDVIIHTGGNIAGHPGIRMMIANERGVTQADMNSNPALKAEIDVEVFDRSTAVEFLLGADRSRYGRLIDNLDNDFLQGRNNYPTTVTGAYHLLTNWKSENRFMGWRPQTSDGLAFVNADRDTTKKPRGRKSQVTCFKCSIKGHYSNECPDGGDAITETQVGTTMLNAGVANGEFDHPRHFQVLQKRSHRN